MTTVNTNLAPAFQAGGLASGLDTQALIDGLVAAESLPLTILKKRKAAYTVQLSTVGDMTGRLNSLKTLADNLNKGAVSVTSSGTYSDFSVTTGPSSLQGAYNIKVTSVASTAKWMSTGFSDSTVI